MSLSPVNVGPATRNKISLQEGWSLDINDYNFDVLSCTVKGTLASILALCPDKYDKPKNITFPSGVSLNGLFCASRKISGGEGLSATANLEFKGYVKPNQKRNPVPSLTWLTASHPVTIAGLTFNFFIPSAAQLTLKFGNTGAYQCAVGKLDVPFGAVGVPDVVEVQVSAGTLGRVTLQVFATSALWICEKHDKQEAGKYTEETQIWTRPYVALI